MRIHHVTIPALEPMRVASALAELLGGRVVPMQHPPDCLLVYAGDSDGSALEVWPAGLRGGPETGALETTELPLPEAWPHHAYVTSDTCDTQEILAVFAREGWRAELVHNGPPQAGFSLVRGWIENRTQIELGGSELRTQYERCAAELNQALGV